VSEDPAAAATQSHPLDNPVWAALTTCQAAFAESDGPARRYDVDVSIFYGVDQLGDAAWAGMARLAGPGGLVVLARAGLGTAPDGWTSPFSALGHQMVLPVLPEATAEEPPIRPLTSDDVAAVLDLIEVARPGPFRPRTMELGAYYGVFDDRRLVAMAGERIRFDGFTEVSAVATHPDARGRGLASALTRRVAAAIVERRETPFLHVADGNDGARRVYERLGFVTRRMLDFRAFIAPS
jgi:ribosomal protein S18 acetylase RimI-like enzyme